MSKVVVKELAKEIGKKSKEIVMYLREQGYEVTNHLSVIEDAEIKAVREKFAQAPAKAKETKASSVKDGQQERPKSGQKEDRPKEGGRQDRPKDGKRDDRSRNRGQREDRPGEGGRQDRPKEDRSRDDRFRDGKRRDDRQGGERRDRGDRPQGGGERRNDRSRSGAGRTQGGRPDGTRSQGGERRDRGDRPQGGERRDRSDRSQGGGERRGDRSQGTGRDGGRQGGGRRDDRRNGDLSIPSAPKDDRMVKTSTTRDRDKEREKDRGRSERDRGDRSRNDRNSKRFDKNKTGMGDDGYKKKKKDPNRKGAFIKPEPVVRPEEPDDGIKTIILPDSMTLKELADKMKQAPAAVVKKLFLAGKMYSINQEITFEEAEEIALEYNCIAEREEKVDVIEELLREAEEDESLMEPRPPVVCVMGHVDHGKTSLLDAIRETNVTSREAGGITQHIGAYVVEVGGRKITFLDTPGHEAFTSMRMRGAQSTDIAILVVAADDGVMPQTVEAINHAKAAGIEIIVAVNKIDKPSANIDRVKQELVEHELIAEDWGGSTIFVPVSAHTKEGIDQLLEMILLTADVCEFKANPNRTARGVVIEAQLDKGRGPVATILVQKGRLHVGEAIAIGSAYGKVRAMVDDKGRRVKEAGPSTPVEVLGLNDVPGAGDIMMAFPSEKEARSVAETFISQGRVKLLEDTKARLSLDSIFSQIQAGNIKELNLIIKADVQGSVEAVKQSLLKLSNDEVAIRVIHGAVGAINESDVSLASASNAIIIGFNVRPDSAAKDTAEREKVDIRLYRVIYNAIEDIEAAMKGMLDPVFEERVIGHAEIRQIFKASGVGNIAGSYVLDGKIVRGCLARITREGEQIYEGSLASLKRFKDDVKEVAAGYECGLVFEKFNDVQELDIAELYVMEEVPR